VTTRQKLTIVGILVAPVLLGLVLMSLRQSQESSFILTPPGKKIGLVRIFDIIYSSENYVWQLRELRKDKSVAGVIVRIESPGGGVAPSQEIYAEVMRYRDEGKPLVVSMGNIAASGAYYLASPASKIFASPGTLTGSLGVILSFPQYYELMDKIGVKMETIKAGKFKDIGTPNREMSKDERRLLQDMIDDTHDQFITDVSVARSMDIDSLRKLCDGRIFSGRQALSLGLIDTLGGFEDAVGFLRAQVGLSEKAKMMEKRRRHSLWKDVLVQDMFEKLPFLRLARRPGGAYYLLESY